MTATILLSLLLLTAADAPAARSVRVTRDVVTPAPERQPIIFTVVGEGKTLEDAQEEALETARKRITEKLRSLRPSLGWQPSAGYLREHNMTRVIRQYERKSELTGLGLLQGVELEVTVTDRQLRDMLAEDRHERQRDRHVQTFKVLGALLAFGFLFAGYVRLEELCRGFFSGLLKVGLLASLAVVGAGLWWVL